MQKPSLGRVVLVTVHPTTNNGADVAPAIITRVWSDTCVNVRVLTDSDQAPVWKTSVALWETREALEANFRERVAEGLVAEGGQPFGAYWPPRV